MPESSSTQVHIGQYAIAPELIEKGYRGGRGPCTCSAVCCSHGVYVDIMERDRILEHREIVKKYMDDTQSRDETRWFERDESEDSDFPSGRCASTEVIGDKCAFLDKLGRCSLQTAATEEGMHRWSLKPLFCILFPLEISDSVIGFDDLLDQEQPCCSISEEYDVPLFEACRDELVHVLGEEGYLKLQEFYRTHVQPRPSSIHEKAMKW